MAYWDKITSRGDVEDRRSMRPAAIGGLSVTGVLVLLAINFLLGGNLNDALSLLQGVPIQNQQNVPSQQYAGQDSYQEFASTVLGSNNDMWKQEFQKLNKTYTEPRLVLFRSATQSGCGYATSEMGPHYCPEDNTIYLDETFFDELTNRFGAKGGDVAQAYVISHEVGHHAQNELGTMSRVVNEEQNNPGMENELSVKLELQADCYAGLWAHSVSDEGVILPGEINEAIDAAAAVGDDRIQKEATGRINPETWTHGSSQQRVNWFNRGYNSGDLNQCNTFG
jgi:predicted metalloprotease